VNRRASPQRLPRQALARETKRETKRAAWKNLQRSAANLLAEI